MLGGLLFRLFHHDPDFTLCLGFCLSHLCLSSPFRITDELFRFLPSILDPLLSALLTFSDCLVASKDISSPPFLICFSYGG